MRFIRSCKIYKSLNVTNQMQIAHRLFIKVIDQYSESLTIDSVHVLGTAHRITIIRFPQDII